LPPEIQWDNELSNISQQPITL